MTYAEPFISLEESFLNLRDALFGLRLAVEEPPDRHALSDLYADSTENLHGALQEAMSAIGAVRSAAGLSAQREAVRNAVAVGQQQYNEITDIFYGDLISHERISELTELRLKRGGKWEPWIFGVQNALEGCRQPLYEAKEALFSCWKAMTGEPAVSRSSPQLDIAI